MSARKFGLAAVTLCFIGGLVAAIFTPAIAATLTLPAASGGGQAQHRPAPVATRAPTSPAAQPTLPANGVTVLARDTFRRPDQSLWGTSSDGRTWGGDANINPAFSIVNHAGQISGGQGALQATLNVTNADAEILLSGLANRFDANGDINLGGVLRWQDPNNWYKVLIDGSRLQLLKDVNGKISVLGTRSFKAVAGTNYSIRFRVLGSDLFAKTWPSSQTEPASWMLMVIDTQLTTGMSGIRVLLVPGAVIRVTLFLETSVSNAM
jgi:hypothetical protein